MKITLTQPTKLTGVETPAGTKLEVTPEFGRELIEKGHAKEEGIIERTVEKIKNAVTKQDETATIKHKDN